MNQLDRRCRAQILGMTIAAAPMTDERIRGRRLQTMRRHYFAHYPLCVACDAKGRITTATELDHIIPLAHGGTNAPDNLQGLCANCHATKTILERGDRVRPTIGPDGYPIQDDDSWRVRHSARA